MQLCIKWRMNQILSAIKTLRATLSQSEIARRTGIAQSKISRWEAGDVPAGASDALALVDFAKKQATARAKTARAAIKTFESEASRK